MRNYIKMVALAGVVATVGLAACAPSPTPAPTGPVFAPTSQAGQASEPPASPTPAPMPSATSSAIAMLTLTQAGKTNVFQPTEVICTGSPGAVKHLIAKHNGGLPLVEVGENFAMVKLQHRGQPEKSQIRPAGVVVEGATMYFTEANIGTMTVSGALTCTTFKG